MKLNKILLTAIAAALLPASVYAGNEWMSGAPESGSHCNLAAMTVTAHMDRKADPVAAEIDALVKSTDDPILASYYLDLYREPATFKTMHFSRAPDPYLDGVILALYGPHELSARLAC
jgi:hypothetical protein